MADDFWPLELNNVNGTPLELSRGTVDKSSAASTVFDAIEEIGIKAGNGRTSWLDVLGVSSAVSSSDSTDTSEKSNLFTYGFQNMYSI